MTQPPNTPTPEAPRKENEVIEKVYDFTGLSPSEAVGQAIGAASMCWEHVEGAGVFDDTEARAIWRGLLAYLHIDESDIEWNE